MKRFAHIITLQFMALVLFLTVPAASYADETPNLQDVQAFEQTLNSVTTLQADFVQTAYNGSQLTGTFYLHRPGRLRFEYNEVDDFIVADGRFIYYYDSDMQQQSNAPIGSTLADFILRDNIRLTGDVQVSDITRQNDVQLVSVHMADDPGAGSLTLAFLGRGDDLKLAGWRVTDSQNLTTTVELSNVKTGVSLRRNLFYYLDPRQFSPNR